MTFIVKRTNPIMYMADEFFSSRIAHRYGLLEAIALSNISRAICDANPADKFMADDGCVYTRCTPAVMAECMPYVTEHQIRRALDNLCKAGAIKRKQLFKDQMDRANWIAIGDIDYE